MDEQILQPINQTNQPIHSPEEMVLQPLELSEAEKKRRAAALLEESNVAVSGSENVAALPETAPVAETAVAETTVAETAPVKAATVSSGKGTGLKVLGGALLLGGVGAAAAGGGSGGDDKPSEPTKPVKPTEPTKPVEPDLTAPVVSLNPLTHINQANQAQTFTLSGSLKADSTATQNTVAVMIGGKSHAATVSGNTWQLKISGNQLASKQGTQEILVTAVSIRGDKTVSSKTVSGSLNVDTQINTPEVSLNDVPNQLSTQQQTVTISGSLKNVDADATVQVRVKLNNGKDKIATVSGNTWKLDVSGSELVGKIGANRITATAIATDKSGNTAQHSDSDTFTVYQPTTTQIVYETGKTADVAGSTATAFNMHSLKDSATVSEQTLRSEYETTFGKDKIATNIQAAYGKDSDNDGVIDRNDKNPNSWDVSERDLRIFSTLAYEEDNILDAGFNQKNSNAINNLHIKNNISEKNHFLNQVDLNEEFIGNWEILHSEGNLTNISGLNFTIFANGKNSNNSYDNIVVAFRGTQITSVSDWANNWKIKNGDLGLDIQELEKIAKIVMSYKPTNVYSTGHSLGGYLAQFFAAYTMTQTTERTKVFKHSALFNPAALKQTDGLGNLITGNDEAELKEAIQKTNQFVREQYIDNSDKTDTNQLYKTNSYVIKGEWVSTGFPTIVNVGAEVVNVIKNPVKSIFNFFKSVFTGESTPSTTSLSFYGLGTYENADILDFKSSDLWGKHDMTSFYENSQSQLKDRFSKGYRIDNWYAKDDTDKDGLTDVQENHFGTNVKTATIINGTDTDKDGFSDRLEIELGADWTTAQKAIALSADRATQFSVAATKTTDTGEFISAQGIELTAQMNGKTIHYTPNGNAINLGIASNEEWQTWLDAGREIQSGSNGNDTLSGSDVVQIIYGGSGDDTLIAGSAQTVLIGGNGSDTFKFTASNLLSGSLNIISDLTTADKLDFSDSQALFSQSSAFKWTSVLGDESLLAKNDAALIWQDDSNTLAYKAQGSSELHTFARFDDSQTLATLQAALIA